MTLALMIDFETLSLKENAVLLALGACAFDPATGEIVSEFYVAIDPRTQHGRDLDAGTVLWWMGQDDAARKKITQAVKDADRVHDLELDTPEYDEAAENAAIPINHAAMAFNAWVESLGQDKIECWSNGGVDHAWLQSMFDYTGFKNPIRYSRQRDYRTLRSLYPDVKAEFQGQKHNALDDAIYQTKHLCAILQRMAKVDRLTELVINGDGEDNEALDIAESLAPRGVDNAD